MTDNNADWAKTTMNELKDNVFRAYKKDQEMTEQSKLEQLIAARKFVFDTLTFGDNIEILDRLDAQIWEEIQALVARVEGESK